MRSWIGWGLALALLPQLTPRAHAYSDPSSYPLPVREGGGGGRWFTGSAVDGFGCNVCHDASGDLQISVTGLPEATGYTANHDYEVWVQWPRELEHLAMVLELVDDRGVRAGSLQLPRFEATTPDEHCTEPGAEKMSASSVIDAESGRQFATVIDCGSRAMRVLWTAPATTTGTVWLAGGLVGSNDDASTDGDVSVMLQRAIKPEGTSSMPVEWTNSAGCSASGGPSGASRSWLSFTALLGVAGVRARRTRKRGAQA